MRLSFVVQIKSDSALASLLRLCWSDIRNGKDTTEVKTVMELKALFFATLVAGLLCFGVLLLFVHMMMVAPIPK
jgi:hypothetical protein